MKIPKERIAWLGAEALRRLKDAPVNDQQRFLLGECVQAYLPLGEEQQREFEGLVAGEPYQGVQALNTTWYEKGLEEGRLRGRQELLRDLLVDSFGPLSPSVLDRIGQLTEDQIAEARKALRHAQSLRDLGLED